MSASPDRLPLRLLLAYGGPTLGIAVLLFVVQFYFLKFATDVLLLPPAAVGVVFGLAKLWDAASNPIVGSWSDRSRSVHGRRRPFLVASLPLLFVGFVLLWVPPPSLGSAGLVAWTAGSLLLFYTAFALYSIPHAALGAELSADSHQRTRLFGARQVSFTLGLLLAFGVLQLAMTADDPRRAIATMAIPVALVSVLLLLVTPLLVREPARGAVAGGQSLGSGLRDVWANEPARRLLLVWFIESAGVGAVGTMAPFIAEYLLGRPDVVGLLPASYVVSGIVSIPLWVPLSRAFGKRETWLVAMLVAAGAFGGMMLVGPGDVALLVLLLVIAGAAMGCGSVLSSAILADVIDLDGERTGERKEGVYSAAMTFVLKIGVAGATTASGFVLGAAGFVPNAAQSAESLLGIRILFAGLPCLGFVLGAVIFWRARFEPSARALPATP